MKVLCINNNPGYWLTVGKEYEILRLPEPGYLKGYIIINDIDYEVWCDIECFTSVKEYRKMKIERLNIWT